MIYQPFGMGIINLRISLTLIQEGCLGIAIKLEIQSRSATNWTKVRLSREDGEKFDLKDFTYQSEGAHTYKIVNPSGDEYVVNTDSSEWGGMEDEVNTNTLEDKFSDISYVDFYSRAIKVSEESTESVDSFGPGTETTLDLDTYSTSYGGDDLTTNTHNLSTIWDGDYKFEDISDPDTGGLSWYGKKIEIQSRSATNWTKVRLSRQDGGNFDLKDFTYQSEGAHTYKIVNPSGDEYVVNTDSSEGGMEDEVNTNTLEDKFSDISYVDFYSRAITTSEDYGDFIDYRTETKWHVDNIKVTGYENFSRRYYC